MSKVKVPSVQCGRGCRRQVARRQHFISLHRLRRRSSNTVIRWMCLLLTSLVYVDLREAKGVFQALHNDVTKFLRWRRADDGAVQTRLHGAVELTTECVGRFVDYRRRCRVVICQPDNEVLRTISRYIIYWRCAAWLLLFPFPSIPMESFPFPFPFPVQCLISHFPDISIPIPSHFHSHCQQ